MEELVLPIFLALAEHTLATFERWNEISKCVWISLVWNFHCHWPETCCAARSLALRLICSSINSCGSWKVQKYRTVYYQAENWWWRRLTCGGLEDGHGSPEVLQTSFLYGCMMLPRTKLLIYSIKAIDLLYKSIEWKCSTSVRRFENIICNII